MASALILCALFSILLASVWLYIQYAYSYWKRRGIPYIEPSFPFGTFKKTMLQKSLLAEELKEMYEKTTEPFIGLYSLLRPSILIRDPALIRDILIKDFSSFNNRGWHVNMDVDPMANNLLVQSDEKWKHSRTSLSPAFTSGKLKGMFETIVKCGDSLEEFIIKEANTGKSVEVREMFARFATTVIASIGFGIEIDCLKEPENEFRKYGRKFFDSNVKNGLRIMAYFLTPALGKLFRSRFVDKDVGEFMIDIVKKTVDYREKNNVTRKDFIQLLMQLRNGEQIKDNTDWTTKTAKGEKFMSLEEMAAQAHLFLIGGFESNSTTMSFCLYELARNPEKQQKAYEDIATILKKYDGKLTYDAMAEMKYMEKCIEEVLRMHSPFGHYTRQTTKDYNISNTNAVIQKGTYVFISASGIHYDAKYFENPKEFIPERFDDDNTFLERPFMRKTYAFGLGPRNCIALRLGKMQAKIGVILMLKKFRFELGAEHIDRELEIDPISQARAPKNGINLKVFSRH